MTLEIFQKMPLNKSKIKKEKKIFFERQIEETVIKEKGKEE